jgi:uncharacterized protein (DUF2147 family)
MLKHLKAILLLISTISIAHAANTNSPIGYWKTIDDVAGTPKSIIEIYETSQHTLEGKVLQIFPKPGEDQNKLCDACKGEKHNQRIVGMVILEGMKQNGEQWDGGQILDPKNGKTYRCKLKVVDHGEKLAVHGYIGMPLLGRTQTWIRDPRTTFDI